MVGPEGVEPSSAGSEPACCAYSLRAEMVVMGGIEPPVASSACDWFTASPGAVPEYITVPYPYRRADRRSYGDLARLRGGVREGPRTPTCAGSRPTASTKLGYADELVDRAGVEPALNHVLSMGPLPAWASGPLFRITKSWRRRGGLNSQDRSQLFSGQRGLPALPNSSARISSVGATAPGY